MSGFFNNGVKVLKDNATNIIGVVKQEVLNNVSPCRTHSQELKDLVNFIIENSVVGDESEEGNTDNIMINNLKKVTTMCDDDINKIIIISGKVFRKLKVAIVLDNILKKNSGTDDNDGCVYYLFDGGKYYFIDYLDKYIAKGNDIFYTNLSKLVSLHNNIIEIKKVELTEELTKDINSACEKVEMYSPNKTSGDKDDLYSTLLNKTEAELDKLYNVIIKVQEQQAGGKRKSKGKSKKVAKKPVASQKKQSIYKEILGKQMKIYKMPDSRMEYVKYKGDLHLITDYKSLIMKQKANAKPKAKPKPKK
jgi:hypothetical protein